MNNYKYIEYLNSLIFNAYNKFLTCNYLIRGNKQIKENVKKNIVWKNKYAGKTCFIFGNGPSLKNVDFSLFQNEYVFTVNLLYKKPDFSKLSSNFHVWSDVVFFNDEVADSTAKEIKVSLLEKGINVFLPSYLFDFVKKYSMENDLNIYNPMWRFNERFKNDINLDFAVMNFGTVVFQCIQIAIYMGFKEIYLLGCDCTGIQSVIAESLKENNLAYCYNIDGNTKKILTHIMNKRDMYEHFRGWAGIFKQYKYINRYCNSKGIKLYNMTNPTILDSIQRVRLEDYFKKS